MSGHPTTQTVCAVRPIGQIVHTSGDHSSTTAERSPFLCFGAAARAAGLLLAQRLDADCLIHQLLVIIRIHRAEHFIDLLLQSGIALFHGDADVDVFI